ncbi:uncharacterized protein V1510DRAFT_406579 [Dipodascopsis tothii]|uniref:uncharacterized protein n=1 Tax=Dipodascopsis tothii TaxID=44089 RepID=UPI0034CD2C72
MKLAENISPGGTLALHERLARKERSTRVPFHISDSTDTRLLMTGPTELDLPPIDYAVRGVKVAVEIAAARRSTALNKDADTIDRLDSTFMVPYHHEGPFDPALTTRHGKKVTDSKSPLKALNVTNLPPAKRMRCSDPEKGCVDDSDAEFSDELSDGLSDDSLADSEMSDASDGSDSDGGRRDEEIRELKQAGIYGRWPGEEFANAGPRAARKSKQARRDQQQRKRRQQRRKRNGHQGPGKRAPKKSGYARLLNMILKRLRRVRRRIYSSTHAKVERPRSPRR